MAVSTMATSKAEQTKIHKKAPSRGVNDVSPAMCADRRGSSAVRGSFYW